LFCAQVLEEKWPKGETFLTFLDKYSVPQKLYFDLEKEDKELCSEITANRYYYLIKNKDGTLNQVLIPVSEEVQLHVYLANGKYKFEILPISYKEYTQTIAVPITSSASKQIQDTTGSNALGVYLKTIFEKSTNFRRMKKGDYIVIEYSQKSLLGRPLGQPDIKSAMVEVSGKKFYRFKNKDDDKYYNQTGKLLTKTYFFRIPLKYTRISSIFTKRRWHPVLKRYRAHFGTDFAAPRGRKIYAAAPGRIIFKGVKGGYGNTIIIKHSNGYKTLYAHQSKFNNSIKKGQWVRKGQLIGYVGSTGLSSGPHLHLGVYKNGRAIDPMKVIKRPEIEQLVGKKKKQFIANAKLKIKELNEKIEKENKAIPIKLDRVNSTSKLNISKDV